MIVTIKIEGEIKTKHEQIECVLELPTGYKPSFNEFCKVKGCIRMLSEKFSQEFSPPPENN